MLIFLKTKRKILSSSEAVFLFFFFVKNIFNFKFCQHGLHLLFGKI